ncbi:MAG: pseudouridine-5'-phosphate glycosidase [Rhodoferax sp.]|jgi:pseudouridine-5'-phosphate glycosidase|nr:pseudouridine-5'-phosphate glycosidase [Rhodoferax sp.]
MPLNSYLDIHPDVAQALDAGAPVVALESTIISHGMPYPDNVKTALRVEDEVRAHGAVPATIAIIDGRLKAGLSPQQIEELGRQGAAVAKVSRRDLPFIVTSGRIGATTVASTMIIAAMAGIRVFATGGIGGVHRGAQQSFDVSADLQELARTSVAVVCAGAKSILDLPLTLEYLETHGVPVVGYRTDSLPAFFTVDSDCGVDYRLDSPQEIAQALIAKWALGLHGGVVVANPVPQAFSMPRARVDAAIEQALREAQERRIGGKAVTPFLLARVSELTGGDSLATNIELVLNNARLASAIAQQFARLGGYDAVNAA